LEKGCSGRLVEKIRNSERVQTKVENNFKADIDPDRVNGAGILIPCRTDQRQEIYG